MSKSGKDILEGKVKDNLRTTLKGAKDAIDAVIDALSDTLTETGRIEIRGLGSFTVKKRDERMGRNPKTGAAVKIAAKKVLVFKPAQGIKKRLN